MMYNVESDVQMVGQHGNAVYPFAKMGINHSFAAPLECAKSIRVLIQRLKKRSPFIFKTAKVFEDGEWKIRVWRIA